MQNFTLEKSDRTAIVNLFTEIYSKREAMTYEAVIKGKTHFEKNFIDTDISDFPNRRKNERYSFYSKLEMSTSLKRLFKDIYALKYIAKNCYCLDEDDRFEIEFDAEIPLGLVEDEAGNLQITHIVKAVFSVRNPEKRNKYYGMPFDLLYYQLIPEED